jgi:hypothetical protein
MKSLTLVATFSLLSTAALAQTEDRAPITGDLEANAFVPGTSSLMPFGGLLAGPYDVTTTVLASPAPGAAWNRELGCARAWGYLWVSGGAGTTGAFAIHQYSLTGTYIQSFAQTIFSASVWGARDLATDEANFKLWGGMESNTLAEYTFNPGGGPNGTLTFTTSYVISGGPGTIRALARNPSTGNFYTKNFNSALFEFSLVPPQVVSTLSGNGLATYGLAYDTANNTLWQFDQFPVGTTDAVQVNETDLTGVLTGRTFMGTVYGAAGTNIAGGCDYFIEGSVSKLLTLHQNTNDELNVYELDTLIPPPVVYCTAGTSTNGCTPSIAASAQPSVTLANACVLTASGVEGQKNGLLFYGIDNSGFSPSPWGAGTSFLCVKAPTQRMVSHGSGGTAGLCDGVLSQDWNAYQTTNPTSLGNPFLVGDDVFVQAWYRDPPAPKTTNLSNAVALTMQP